MNRAVFLAYIEPVLAPELLLGDLAICDNLSSHKVSSVSAAIEHRGARLLYLPTYNPDLNPIEMAFSKLKSSLLHSAARSLHSLQLATTSALDSFSPSICHNLFHHAHHASD